MAENILVQRAEFVREVETSAFGVVEKPQLIAEEAAGNPTLDAAFLGHKTTSNGEQMALYQRDNLPIGAIFNGPALAFQFDSTIYVAGGWQLYCHSGALQ